MTNGWRGLGHWSGTPTDITYWVIEMTAIRGLLPAALALAVSTTLAGEAQGAAFHLYERSVQAAGRAFAGAAAATDDPGILTYNPAGMTELDGPRLAIGAFGVKPRGKLEDAGSNLSIGPFGPFPVGGDSQGQGFHTQASGYAYGALPLSDRLWAGMAVTVPFGLKSKYESDYFGRYDSLATSLVVMEFAPSVAYRLSERISIGGSLDIQRADAKLSNALPNPLDPNGPNPASDGRLTVKGDDWSVGYQLGLHVRPTELVEIGLAYRSGITHALEGSALTEFAGTTSRMGAMADLKLPDIISLGATIKATDRLTLLAQVDHFRWSRFEELHLVFEDATEAVTTEDFRNSWSLSAGGDYAVTQALTVRAGLLYETTPTRDAHRSTLIPDTNRLWAGLGASYAIGGGWAIDLSYMRFFSNSGPINRDNEFAALGTSVHTVATTRTSSNVLGLGLGARF